MSKKMNSFDFSLVKQPKNGFDRPKMGGFMSL